MKQMLAVLPLDENNRERIRSAAERHGYFVRFCASLEESLPWLPEAEIILGQDARLSAGAPRLQWICTPSAGVDHFLAESAFARSEALLTHSSGAYGVTIAEHAVMVTLELLRRMPEYREIVSRREWKRDLRIRSIRGSRVLLLGTGDIGQETAIRMRAFAPAEIIGVNRRGANPRDLFDRIAPVSALPDLLPKTDLLIASLPATKSTDSLLCADLLALLPADAFLVNVGRGSVLDETALLRMLQENRLAGAALDVFAREPLPQDSPLWNCPGLLITPHIAGNMTLQYTVDRITDLFLEDLDAFCAGRPMAGLVDRDQGY